MGGRAASRVIRRAPRPGVKDLLVGPGECDDVDVGGALDARGGRDRGWARLERVGAQGLVGGGDAAVSLAVTRSGRSVTCSPVSTRPGT